ncbi:MAG: O-antigen ligase family protein [Alphaproteobacteria bacterium]
MRMAAVAAGLAVPALVSGRATLGLLCLVTLAATLAAPGLRAAWRRTLKAAVTPLGFGVLAVLASWLVSTALSYNPWTSAQTWGRVTVFVGATAFLVHRLKADRAALALGGKTLVAASVAAAAIAIIGPTVLPDLVALVRGKAPGWHGYEAAQALKGFGSALACLMPVVLWAGTFADGRWRLAAFAFQPLAVAAMAVTESEAGLAGAALALLAGAATWFRRGLGLAATLAIVLGGAVAALLAGFGPLGPGFAAIDPHRQAIWAAALAYWPEAPLFGHGVDVANLLPGADAIVPAFNQARIPSHPHDWAVEVMVETGLAGSAALMAAIAQLTVRIAHLDRAGSAAGLGLMAAFWGSGLVNFSLWAAWWQGVLLILLAFLLATGGRARPPSGS